MSRDRRVPLILAAIYLAVRAVWAAAGAPLYGVEHDGAWQVLPADTLKHDLFRGLLAMHSQPPLYNVILGLVYKTPWPGVTANAILACTGVVILLTLHALLRRLGVSRGPAAIAALAFVLYPSFTIYDHTFFYTLFEIALLQGAGLALLVAGTNAVERRSTSTPMIWFAICVSGLVALRPFYHPLWVLAVAAAAAWGFWRMRIPLTRRTIVCLLSPMLVAGAIMTKNYWLVGQPVTGTWTGMHLSRLVQRWSVPDHMLELRRTGVLSTLSTKDSFQHLATYADVREAYAARIPEPAFTHPALTEPVKAESQWPNFNQVEFIAIASVKLSDSLAYISHYPGDYLRGVFHNYGAITSAASYTSVAAQVGDVVGRQVLWSHTPVGRWFVRVPVILMLLLTLTVIIRRLGWPRDSDQPRGSAPALAFMLVTIAYVVMLSTAMEVDELPRYRTPIDPWLYAVSVATVCRIKR